MVYTVRAMTDAKHLRIPRNAHLYMVACAEGDPGDGSLIRAGLNDIARAGNMSRLARDAGLSREGLLQGPVRERQPELRHGGADRPGPGNAAADYDVARTGISSSATRSDACHSE